ncbi:MAG: metallophosphoesterase [Ruminococcus sp.]|nr:metallophosphoesterase [Ruminococcus sp.]
MAEKKNIRAIKKKRRQTAGFIIFCIVLFFVWYFNNYTLKLNKSSVYSSKISSDVRIAVIADMHAHRNGMGSETVFRKINGANPDMVFILGDMYSRGSSDDIIQIPLDLADMLIASGYPTFFVPGEHDNGKDYMNKLSETGVHVLCYRNEYITIRNNVFNIIGIDNAYYSPTFDLRNEFQTDGSCYNILMAHIPNYEKFSLFGADLTLCADTHGGMIQLPFGGGTVYDPYSGIYFPELKGYKNIYDKGWFEYKGGAMFITSGIGDSPAPIRFNNRPEVAVIDIKAGD